uniref:Elongation of fatty acids protein n=1 Tax=Arcella intermedia TaxID=1963864 RepID=A0A6B2LE85_9EUKA
MSLVEVLNQYWEKWMDYADPRVASWPMMSSPLPTLGFILMYLGILYFGKIWMKNRKGYELKGVLIIYNIFLVLLSTYMAGGIFYESIFVLKYNIICNPLRTENSEGLARVIWIFFISKLIETLDTIIMLFRKKDDQISFLHVYHHCSVIILWWIGARFVPGGDAAFSAFQNSFVHAVMYTYYLLSSLGITVWWKKYITKLQMMQFFLNILHSAIALLLPECGDMPRWMGYGMVTYMLSLLVLFLKFYAGAYSGKKHQKPKKQ